jgi:hypothetical protein
MILTNYIKKLRLTPIVGLLVLFVSLLKDTYLIKLIATGYLNDAFYVWALKSPASVFLAPNLTGNVQVDLVIAFAQLTLAVAFAESAFRKRVVFGLGIFFHICAAATTWTVGKSSLANLDDFKYPDSGPSGVSIGLASFYIVTKLLNSSTLKQKTAWLSALIILAALGIGLFVILDSPSAYMAHTVVIVIGALSAVACTKYKKV